MSLLGSLLVVLMISAEPAPADSSSAAGAQDEAIRLAIERGLPYLEKDGVTWIEERKCASCHQVPGMLWGFNAARRHGAAVDPDKLAEWSDWSFNFAVTNLGQDEQRDGGGLDTMTQLIAGRDDDRDDETTRTRLLNLAQLIVAAQQDDGSWKPAGQLPGQTRPLDDTTQVTTAWAALALTSIPDVPPEVVASRDKALEFLQQTDEGKSGEWWAVMLLVAHLHGERDRESSLLHGTLALQNEDGGWSFAPGKPSSPMATGQTLYALAAIGLPSADSAIARARQYLIDTQLDDGSWAMPSTLERKKGEVYPIANYWGTGWAVAGLAQTLAP
jgi:squalene-hopene/tetraprenyl-beta-curcumene cyclase